MLHYVSLKPVFLVLEEPHFQKLIFTMSDIMSIFTYLIGVAVPSNIIHTWSIFVPVLFSITYISNFTIYLVHPNTRENLSNNTSSIDLLIHC